jgi:hypothetical protein
MLQTYNLKQGLHQYGQKGREEELEEIRQLHERSVFIPIDVSVMKPKVVRYNGIHMQSIPFYNVYVF